MKRGKLKLNSNNYNNNNNNEYIGAMAIKC